MNDELKKNKDRQTTEKAIALKYHDADELPTIIAKGTGEVARQIIELARSNGIPVQQDETLAELLSKIDVSHDIPEESFRLVAEVLSFLYFTDQEWRDNNPHLKEILGPVDPSSDQIEKDEKGED